ncbi:ABC transporter ATP-binding protein [Segnochrobactrum spirostomi]|uniref:ABC transporter ATP-binding protein n=1 Tax=Segnochrobactrum spirostomi TaxID=2608987 RepID=A0A6A7YCU3_9HYPH|nr:ABC transporter ATP-binding protein [Segnochrobactrum spirostomi]MQT15512.1 ABC transporter ATP-binding protein [Segnochrobactrum spirostomi]
MSEPDQPKLLEMRNIVRSFGTLRANDDIDLDLGHGEILGLLGENGSGKSTLMKILFGMVPPDAGTIRFEGALFDAHTPADAIAAGIAMIHQHFMLIEAMSVTENIMLGWRDAGRVLKPRAMAERIREASQRFGLDLDPDARIADLPLGRRQRVEILKAILRQAKLLILDEPTSNLAPVEVRELLDILRRLKAEGTGIIFISHKLPEVLEVCDRVVVLRAGKLAGATPVAGVSRATLAEMMVGRHVPMPRVEAGDRPRGALALSVRGLEGPGLTPITFDVRGGEILGIAGVDGNGQLELAETLAGLAPATGGLVLIADHDATSLPTVERIDLGLAYLPADRSHTALVKSMTILDNLMLRDSRRAPYGTRWALTPKRGAAQARALMERCDIRAQNPDFVVGRLSGGNQQKVVIARELDRQPKVVVAHQATWGLDPGATRFVLDEMIALRAAGAAIVYISSELEEILSISDRIAVMAGGGFAGIVPNRDVDLQEIGLWMSGRAA